ncbi:sodium-dependent proline transporter-like isoform X2 [Pieris rapae]|uniref:sodium-dependent proline transporter-like isoform X2 n=1 Tax=Pieris rapae TaxID=64459 RepID=UPI001E27DAC4|nr:sodium-dependent proline transporter-like isoform X2 [Pieris rapae]
MSDTVSTRSKTVSSTDSESTEGPLIEDRWTNNISYRQLVISSCIGILQVWWHPYLHDFARFLPFLFLYNLFSVFFAYPLFYLELALGVVTRKGVLNSWDMSPSARGIGIAMLITSTFTVLSLGVVSAWCLALTVHSMHSFLPWLHCAADANPPCAARHRPLPEGSETPAQSFFFNFVLNLKRNGLSDGLGNVVPELTVYYVISWILVYLIACKRIYSYSKMVLFKDALTYFSLVVCAVGVTRLNGASRMFTECDWGVLFNGFQVWREAIEYSFLQMCVSQGTLIMLGSYCPKQKQKLTNTAMLAFAVSKTCCTGTAFILGAVHGALHLDYDNSTRIWGGTSSSIVLWSDYVARIPGSQFWSFLIFFSLFVLSLSSMALLVQTIISTFTGRLVRKIRWAFLILICFLFCFIGILTLCTQGGLYILNFLMRWPVSKPRAPIAAVLTLVVTFVYGQTAFCEDVYFAVGEYPSVFLRICWALAPLILMSTFLSGKSYGLFEASIGWTLVSLTLLPIVIVMLLYLIFKFRVRVCIYKLFTRTAFLSNTPSHRRGIMSILLIKISFRI